MSLDEIRQRVKFQPALQGTLAHDEHPASIFEEEDGLETLLYAPEAFSTQAQDNIVKMFLDMANDRRRLLQALDAVTAMVAETSEQFSATLNRMNNEVAERNPQRPDAETVIRYGAYAGAWSSAKHRVDMMIIEGLATECDGSKECKALQHDHGCWGQS